MKLVMGLKTLADFLAGAVVLAEAAAKNGRESMANVYLEVKDGDFDVYSTDGHRVFLARERGVEAYTDGGPDSCAIPHEKALRLAKNLANALRSSLTAARVDVEIGAQTITVRDYHFATTEGLALDAQDCKHALYAFAVAEHGVGLYDDRVALFGVDGGYMADACKLANIFRDTVTKTVRGKQVTKRAEIARLVLQSKGPHEPILVRFGDERAKLVVMPVRV